MLGKMIQYGTGIQVNPPKHIDSEYRRAKQRSIARAIDTFTPSEDFDGLSVGSMLKMFLMNPMQGVFRK